MLPDWYTLAGNVGGWGNFNLSLILLLPETLKVGPLI